MTSKTSNDDEWGVYTTKCEQCQRPIAVVATVASVKGGYAEGLNHPRCIICITADTISPN